MTSQRSDHALVSSKKIKGYSDINHQKALDWSDSIEFLRKRFDAIPVKFRDPRIEAALSEVEAAPPSRQFFVEYMITNYRLGFLGPSVSQDILAATIRRVTHSKMFGVRTLRDSATWAAGAGFITRQWVPIGLRVVTAQGEHRTKRIRRYTSTNKIRLLASILRLDPNKYKSELLLVSDKNIPCPTSEKIAANPTGEQPRDIKSRGMLLSHCQIDETEHLPRGGRSKGSEVLPASAANVTTKPALLGPTVKHESLTPTGAPKRRLKRPNSMAVPFGRRNRASAPTTYQGARKQFLHDLWVFLKPDTAGAVPNAFDLYRIAELQTDRFYPANLPTALDWYDRLVSNYFENWHTRRRAISRIVVPALEGFANDWTPPRAPAEPGPEYQRAVDDWALSLCPAPGISVRPEHVSEFYRLWPFVRSVLSLIHAGDLKFEYSTTQSRQSPVFQFCRLFFSSDNI